MVAEETSAKLKTLDLRRKIPDRKYILQLMGRLEVELGGTAGNSIDM